MDLYRSVFSGCFSALSSSAARSRTTLLPSIRVASLVFPLPPFGGEAGFPFLPFPSAMLVPLSDPDDRTRVVELRSLALRPSVKTTQVHDDLSLRIELDVRAIHRPRRGPLEVNALGVVAAAMAGALKLVL